MGGDRCMNEILAPFWRGIFDSANPDVRARFPGPVDHRSIRYKGRTHDPCSAGHKLDCCCGLHLSKCVPRNFTDAHQRPTQPAGSGHSLHMAPYTQTFSTDSYICFKIHCWQGSAPHCKQERLIQGSTWKGEGCRNAKHPCVLPADSALHE